MNLQDRLLHELSIQLEYVVDDKVNSYADEEFLEDLIATEFAFWLVDKFREECKTI